MSTVGSLLIDGHKGVTVLRNKVRLMAKALLFTDTEAVNMAILITDLGTDVLEQNLQFNISVTLYNSDTKRVCYQLSCENQIMIHESGEFRTFFDEVEITKKKDYSVISFCKTLSEQSITIDDSLLENIQSGILKLTEKELLVQLEEKNLKLEAAYKELKRSQEVLLNQTQTMANVGGWEINLSDMTTSWTEQVYHIHELPLSHQPTVDKGIEFYAPEARPIIKEAVAKAIEFGTPWDLELPFITAKNNHLWVRAMGNVTRENNKTIRVNGAFQDITDRVNAEKKLENAMETMKEQNKRLVNFAHIVSHNLRSHTGNLSMMLEFLKDEDSTENKKQIQTHIENISETLGSTVDHLTKVVQIQTDLNVDKQSINLKKSVERAIAALSADLMKIDAEVINTIDPGEEVVSNPAYLDSILLNLVSNSVKYRNPDHLLKITITSGKNEGFIYFSVEDNGLGIDLKRHGHKLFGLNKTFHKHHDSRGVGLFMTKNQVEALNGSIEVESTPMIGTTFKVNIPHEN